MELLRDIFITAIISLENIFNHIAMMRITICYLQSNLFTEKKKKTIIFQFHKL